MDAEHMAFNDNSYDYIWSWGVIHHSADTRRVLEEMHRVLRPGGKCTVMIYYRSWWHFYVCGFLRGVFQNQFKKQRDLHQVAQGATDGAIARHYTVSEWRSTAMRSLASNLLEYLRPQNANYTSAVWQAQGVPGKPYSE